MASAKIFHTHFLKLSIRKPSASVFPCIISVRFRKPRWIPRAPSKEFYVPPEKPYKLTPVEEDKLRRSYDLYRNEVAAIRYSLLLQVFKK